MKYIALLLVFLALPVAADQEPQIQVIKVACDAAGGVTALMLRSGGPATTVVRWDNRKVCGTPA